MKEPLDTKQTAGKHRSPAYPMFSLSTAIEKVRKFYEANRRNPVLSTAAVLALGYKHMTGVGGRTLATLAEYGLLSEAGKKESRQFQITELAYRIIVGEPGSIASQDAIREAATRPRIYSELLDEYPNDLPSDPTIREWLIFTKKFNPAVVKDVIRDFRDTYEFANLQCREDGGEAPQDESTQHVGDTSGAKKDTPRGTDGPHNRSLRIPLGPDSEVVIAYPLSFSTADFDFLIQTLNHYKSRITSARLRDDGSELL